MAIQRIPTPFPNEPLVTQTTTMDGKDYILTFDWVGRDQKWYLKLSDADNNTIIAGIKLVPNIKLLLTNASLARPPGDLVLLTVDGLDPTIDTLQDATFLYITEDEGI